MKVGFTGTRNGMTPDQRKAFIDIVADAPIDQFHHGACVGADTDAVVALSFIRRETCRIIAHPGKSAKGGENDDLSFLAIELSNEVLEAKTHFARNRDIVAHAELMIACPCHADPITTTTRGGTAYTVMQARSRSRELWIIRPDGSLKHEAAGDYFKEGWQP
jgi:hypothetical protein